MRHSLSSLALLATLTACGGGGGNQAASDIDTSPAAVLQVQAVPSAIEVSTTSSAVAAKAVDLTDAIAILKMIVGLDVNAGGAALSAYQAYAADVDGNGKVELSDAISVLKRIVGLETASANWMFFNGTPTVADKLNPGVPASVSAAVSNSTNVSMTAVLRGDVVSSSAFTYSWALTSKPSSSNASITNTTAANPGFIADVAGAYVATMTITDGSSNVATSAVTLSLALYNDTDYLNKTHPPLIGFGYDGIALFGKYREPTDAALLGYTSKLDDFGAHNHDGMGYHYHAHTVSNHTPVGQTYTATLYVLMKGAYIGKVTTVPYFRAKTTFGTNKYLGGTVQ